MEEKIRYQRLRTLLERNGLKYDIKDDSEVKQAGLRVIHEGQPDGSVKILLCRVVDEVSYTKEEAEL